MKIVYGTHNKGKIEAMRRIIEKYKYDVEVFTPKEIGFDKEVIEDGKTFEENSAIKANAVKEFCNNNGMKDVIIIIEIRT